jgi:phenylacetate-coenzyme A ligase PaaK-like adenylate-forming protein
MGATTQSKFCPIAAHRADEANAVVYPESYPRACASVLDTGLSSVPAYAGWKRLDPGPQAGVRARFSALPSITKADMRRHSHAGFCTPDRNAARALEAKTIKIVQTSGSTGDQVSNIWYQPWWDGSELSSWKLNSAARRVADGTQREAILTSPLCAGFVCEDGLLPMTERRTGRFLYLNERSDPTTWTPEHMDRMLGEMNEFRPVTLEANPSFLARLSRHIVRRQARVRPPALIVLTYENPSLLHYRQIRAAFDAPIASSYGSTEAGYVFMECEHGRLHQNVDCCHVDFLPFRQEHGGPDTGSLLVTTLDNPWRILIRFDIGDVARLCHLACPCGRRAGITLESIEGRAVNLTLDIHGRVVTQGAVDRAMATVANLEEYQVIQESRCSYRLKIAADDAESAGQAAARSLLGVYGEGAVIVVEHLPSIRPDPPGKYRLARALFDIDVADYIDPRFKPGVP